MGTMEYSYTSMTLKQTVYFDWYLLIGVQITIEMLLLYWGMAFFHRLFSNTRIQYRGCPLSKLLTRCCVCGCVWSSLYIIHPTTLILNHSFHLHHLHTFILVHLKTQSNFVIHKLAYCWPSLFPNTLLIDLWPAMTRKYLLKMLTADWGICHSIID